jgi:hypothetical protein
MSNSGLDPATGDFEQEETEETEVFFSVLCSLFSLLAPVQNCFLMRRYRLANTPPDRRHNQEVKARVEKFFALA